MGRSPVVTGFVALWDQKTLPVTGGVIREMLFFFIFFERIIQIRSPGGK